MEDAEETVKKQDKQPWLKKYRWPKGVSGNPHGRPQGSVSPKERIREMFIANPEDFDEFLEGYLNDPNNRRHVVELFEGKPAQSIDHTTQGKELPQPIININGILADNSNQEGGEDEQENPSDSGWDISK